MKIHFLGTNGWYSTSTGNTVCTLIDSEKFYVILDAGDGIYKAKELIKENKPIHLFISHLHLDHIYGFHIFPTFTKDRNVSIILENGNLDLIKSIARRPFMVSMNDNVNFYEASEGCQKEPIIFKCLKLNHFDPSIGYRMEIEGKSVAYCLDTGICNNLLELSKNADILITECSLMPGISNPEWGHLSPEEAAQVAKEAEAKKMVMTHFSVSHADTESRINSQEIARKIFPETIAASDDMIIEV